MPSGVGRNQTGRMCRVYWVSGQSEWSIGNDWKGSEIKYVLQEGGSKKLGT